MLAFVVAPRSRAHSDLQHSLTITTAAFVVAGFVLYLFTFLTAREQVQRDAAVVSMRQSFGTLGHNRPLLLLCLSSLLFLTGLISLSTVGAFYARDVLGNANLFIVLTLAQTVGTFVIAPFVPLLTRTVGKKRLLHRLRRRGPRRASSASPWRPVRFPRSPSPVLPRRRGPRAASTP